MMEIIPRYIGTLLPYMNWKEAGPHMSCKNGSVHFRKTFKKSHTHTMVDYQEIKVYSVP